MKNNNEDIVTIICSCGDKTEICFYHQYFEFGELEDYFTCDCGREYKVSMSVNADEINKYKKENIK